MSSSTKITEIDSFDSFLQSLCNVESYEPTYFLDSTSSEDIEVDKKHNTAGQVVKHLLIPAPDGGQKLCRDLLFPSTVQQ